MAPMSVMNLRHGYHPTKRLDPRDRGKEEVESGGPEREGRRRKGEKACSAVCDGQKKRTFVCPVLSDCAVRVKIR